jgi:hypothetical protein
VHGIDHYLIINDEKIKSWVCSYLTSKDMIVEENGGVQHRRKINRNTIKFLKLIGLYPAENFIFTTYLK